MHNPYGIAAIKMLPGTLLNQPAKRIQPKSRFLLELEAKQDIEKRLSKVHCSHCKKFEYDCIDCGEALEDMRRNVTQMVRK